jgi:DNA-binding MarR family transcriptional regulator
LEEERFSHGQRSINFRVHALASSLFKGASQYYGAYYDVSLPEMRVLSNLGREGELAAYRIVELTVMDKALVSRVLRSLARRGLIASTAPKSDPRRRSWRLSQAGKDMVKRLRPEWRRREAIIQDGLSKSERAILTKLLDRLFIASEKLREAEAEQIQGRRKAAARPGSKAKPANGRARRESAHIF